MSPRSFARTQETWPLFDAPLRAPPLTVRAQSLPPQNPSSVRNPYPTTGSAIRVGTMWLGLESILIAQVTGMWTAFETLAGDLWESALNLHPYGLSELKGKRPKKKRKTMSEVSKQPPDLPEEKDEQEEPEDRWLKVRGLQRFNYNLSQSMGTVLKHRFNFTRLERCRDAYYAAFHKDNDAILIAIDNQAIDALKEVRNLIVHRAGRADEEFWKKTRKIPDLSSISINQQLPIDGSLVKALVAPVIGHCANLILAVNKWVQDHTAERR